MFKTNVWGPKWMSDAYIPLLDQNVGRIVNMGSGAGPMYFKNHNASEQEKNFLKSDSNTWEQLVAFMDEHMPQLPKEGFKPYCMTKALLHNYNMISARENPNLMVSAVSPGFIDTAMTAGMGAKLTPEQGTVSTRHCLF